MIKLEHEQYPLLSGIRCPADAKKIDKKDLPKLCAEIRTFLIAEVERLGGHLASNLGVVELSVALHRVFDTPTDHIIWDVGHQCYTHKILTGRLENFDTLRTVGGLGGFPSRRESEHDAFGAGHSSTAISAGLGFAEADYLDGKKNYTIAVVGDGAFTGGMVHEALNNCRPELRLIVVLNDNEMSISKSIGRFATHLSRIRISKSYNRTKNGIRRFFDKIPLVGKPLRRGLTAIKRWLKNTLYGSNYFEDMGLFYLGPIDGNDSEQVEIALREAKNRSENILLHIKTKKGKGYAPAEENPENFHSVGCEKDCSYHAIAGKKLTRLAQEDESICAITAAMGLGTGLDYFGAEHKARYFDVGIAEEHALTFAAGLAAAGKKPYFAVYSTFLQRGYDNLLHDVALQSLPVRLLIDRASLAPSDGATHHGIFDVAMLSHVPGMTLWAPATLGSLEAMLEQSVDTMTPLAIRYPNDTENKQVRESFYPDENYHHFGVRADYKPEDSPSTILIGYGKIICEVLKAKEILKGKGVTVGVILLEKLAPYAETAKDVLALLPKRANICFVEEGIHDGGAGMMLREYLTREQETILVEYPYVCRAIETGFTIPTEKINLYDYCRLSAKHIVETVLAM